MLDEKSFSKGRLLYFALDRGLLEILLCLWRGWLALRLALHHGWRILRYRLLVAWILMTDPRWVMSFIPRPIRRLVPPRWQKEILRRL
jgi:hypothetical protein